MTLPMNGATILFGSTDGARAGYCSRAPGLGPAYSVSLYRNGRLVVRGVPQRLPIRHPTAATVRRLVQRARADHFFHIPTFTRDVSCPGAATVYLRIDTGALRHTVEIYGYTDSRHPALYDLFLALWQATLD